MYPKFYKNKHRYTCIKSETEFIEIQLSNNLASITYGNNVCFVNNAKNYGIEIKGSEFASVFVNHTYAAIECAEDAIKDVMKNLEPVY